MRRPRLGRRAAASLDPAALAGITGGLGMIPDCPSPPDLTEPRADLQMIPDCPSPPP